MDLREAAKKKLTEWSAHYRFFMAVFSPVDLETGAVIGDDDRRKMATDYADHAIGLKP